MGRLLAALALMSSACADDSPVLDQRLIDRGARDVIVLGAGDAAAPADVTADAIIGPGPADTEPGAGDAVPAVDLAAGEVDGGPLPPTPTLPARVALPWVPADGTASTVIVRVDGAGVGTTFSLDGDPLLRIAGSAPASDTPEAMELTLSFGGAAQMHRAFARLEVRVNGQREAAAEVHAMAGSPSPLPPATWAPLEAPPVTYGVGATVPLATAPFPHSSGTWRDDSVHIFVPDGYTPGETVDMAVHFHGHYARLATTLTAHYYREQLWASGTNLVLVVPQGPLAAASGNFGRLMSAPGLENLLDDVAAILFRDGLTLSPRVGDIVLTEHSGGYIATAANLDTMSGDGAVLSAHLFDGLYARSADFRRFAEEGGHLRSVHTAGGGTRVNNLNLLSALGPLGTDLPTAANLRDARAVIWPTTAGHNQATWWDRAYCESLRWSFTRARRGPRVELREARVDGDLLTVRWLAPDDEALLAHVIETSSDGQSWSIAAEVPPDRDRATLTLAPTAPGLWVRHRARLVDVGPEGSLRSDAYWAGREATVLVVDGFDRIIGGSWRDLSHPAAGRVGAAVGGAHAASNEAVSEGEVRLQDYPVVIWLLGDESSADRTFTPQEQALILAYLDGGGRFIASGAEIAWDLGARNAGPGFLATLGATFVADDAGVLTASGVGPLAHIGAFAFGGPDALYPEDFPDVLGTAAGAERLLVYPDARAAAVGKAGASAVVGFPLELIEDTSVLRSVLSALIEFVW